MRTGTEDRTEPEAPNAFEECERQLEFLRHEANRSKLLTYTATLAIMLSSASVPILILISTEAGGFVVGKLLPAIAAAVAALAAGASQLVRPHDRWRAFRRAQRLLEAERMAYLHSMDRYACGNRDNVLIQEVLDSKRAILDEWTQLMPETSAALTAATESLRKSKT